MHEESKTIILTQRLWREAIRRSRYTSLLHIGVMSAGMIVAREMHQAHPVTLRAFGLVIIVSVIRAFIIRRMKMTGIPSKKLETAYLLCLALMGSAWGLFWYDVHLYYGMTSIQSIFGLVTISAMLSGGVGPHAPRPMGYVVFSLFVAAVPLTIFFSQLKVEVTTLSMSVCFYLIFNYVQLRSSHLMIKNYFESELQIQFERNKIQTLVNAVPGYVFFIDKNLNFIMVNEYARLVFHLNEIRVERLLICNRDRIF